jgi:hypothetical protein
MVVRQIALGLAAIFAIYGLGLAIVGVGIAPAHLVGGVAAITGGSGLAIYGVRLGVATRRGRLPEWIRDLRIRNLQ